MLRVRELCSDTVRVTVMSVELVSNDCRKKFSQKLKVEHDARKKAKIAKAEG